MYSVMSVFEAPWLQDLLLLDGMPNRIALRAFVLCLFVSLASIMFLLGYRTFAEFTANPIDSIASISEIQKMTAPESIDTFSLVSRKR